jgi:hypothetical protein
MIVHHDVVIGESEFKKVLPGDVRQRVIAGNAEYLAALVRYVVC